jgi:hypothetical protein
VVRSSVFIVMFEFTFVMEPMGGRAPSRLESRMTDDRTFSLGPDREGTLPVGPPNSVAAGEGVGTVIGPYRLNRFA